MNPKLIYVFLFFVLVSCNYKNHFPSKKSERILTGNTTVTQQYSNNYGPFETLFTFVTQFESQSSAFDLQAFENEYDQFLNKKSEGFKNIQALPAWVEINGLLLELTGKEKYAEVLEDLSENETLTEYIKPFILTKYVDHIYVNLFEPIEISYNHTLGGEVTFRQETSYPESGSVRLHFEMTERRYIELNIRIPEWAEGTSVTVKGVKYFTQPGTYCFIAKKWKQGDLVEIELPIEKYPVRLP